MNKQSDDGQDVQEVRVFQLVFSTQLTTRRNAGTENEQVKVMHVLRTYLDRRQIGRPDLPGPNLVECFGESTTATTKVPPYTRVLEAHALGIDPDHLSIIAVVTMIMMGLFLVVLFVSSAGVVPFPHVPDQKSKARYRSGSLMLINSK